MKSAFPYRPPLEEVRPSVALVLDLAFGPISTPRQSRPEREGEDLLATAHSMALAARIGARWSQKVLTDRFGPDAADGFARARRRTGAVDLQTEAISEHIAKVAADLGMPVVFLKGAALVLEGRILPGSRGLGDIDVLTPDGRQQELQDRLKAEGCFEPENLPSGEHQLQALGHPFGLAVEVHLCLRGVRNPSGKSMTLSDLERAGLVHRIEKLPGDARVPEVDLLLAHAVVHGLAQHGLNPKGYPMLRFVADIVDLDLANFILSESYEQWMPWVEQDVSRREVEALAEMCRRLSEGESASDIWRGNGDDSLILRHLVLGATDIEYRDSLRIWSLASALPSGGRVATLARTVWHATILTRGQVDALYGRPSSPLGYWGYRLYRPFDLIGRTIRFGGAAIKGRRR